MFVQISAGLAPVESCRFVYLFWNTLLKECLSKKINVKIINSTKGPENNTYKSVFLELSGQEAREYAKSIEGSILWIYKSEYRMNHKRNNWYIEVEIYDDLELINHNTNDIKIDTLRSSGNGGQNVNKLETGIRITHLPTNIVVTAQDERSQLQNKKIAQKRLEMALKNLIILQEKNIKKAKWEKHQNIKRGQPIRIFKGPDFKEIKLSKRINKE